MMDFLNQLSGSVGSIVWGWPTVILILAVGIYLSVGTRFFQLTNFKHWMGSCMRGIFQSRSKSDTNQISQFQSVCTALASSIGTGNIAGVSVALSVGGPGSIFWMWVSALFGMMTSYSENVLGIYYRHRSTTGEWNGGPMYYLRDGLSCKKYTSKLGVILASLFSIFCIFASFGMGNMAQINSIAYTVKSNFGIPPLFCGIALALLSAFIIVGGIGRIGKTTEKLVPFMAGFYIVSALVILVINRTQISYVFSSILKSAFNVNSAVGGTLGYFIKYTVSIGFKRGVFSNEAGLGSSVIAHSASDVKNPVTQGMWGIFTVFVDTIVICSVTAFVLLSSTCNAVSLEEALSDIGKSAEYIYISDSPSGTVPLLSTLANQQYTPSTSKDESAQCYNVTPKNGIPFKIYLTQGGNSSTTYTNIMSVRGITVDNSGNEIRSSNLPVNAVTFESVEGAQLVAYAFSMCFGSWAGKLMAIAIFFFAYSTILGWSYYGTKSWEYLFGSSTVVIYKIIYVLLIVIGSVSAMSLIWDISDIFNGLMAIPNLIGLTMLSGTVFKITRNYQNRNSSNWTPMFSAFSDIQKTMLKNKEKR